MRAGEEDARGHGNSGKGLLPRAEVSSGSCTLSESGFHGTYQETKQMEKHKVVSSMENQDVYENRAYGPWAEQVSWGPAS